jgi:hypothetical protein
LLREPIKGLFSRRAVDPSYNSSAASEKNSMTDAC